MALKTKVSLSNQRIKGFAIYYKTTQKMIKKLVNQFGNSALFDMALIKYIEERV